MAKTSLVPIPEDIRAKAKELYLAHTPINDIAHQLKVSTATLAQWRTRESWLAEREAADEALLTDIISARKVELSHIAKAGIAQIKRAIKHIEDDPEPMSIAVAEKMANLIATLDKVHRLDTKQATENVSVAADIGGGITVDRIREIVTTDAFLAPEGAERE